MNLGSLLGLTHHLLLKRKKGRKHILFSTRKSTNDGQWNLSHQKHYKSRCLTVLEMLPGLGKTPHVETLGL